MSRSYSDYLPVGKITSTHALKGEIKVYPSLDDPDRFSSFKSVILDDGKQKREVNIERVRFSNKMIIVKLEGVDDVETAFTLRGSELLARREEICTLSEWQYFRADLIGLEVYRDSGELLGSLTDVIRTGANDVYEVKMESGGVVLIPAIRQCILKVDIEGGSMTVHLLEGLL